MEKQIKDVVKNDIVLYKVNKDMLIDDGEFLSLPLIVSQVVKTENGYVITYQNADIMSRHSITDCVSVLSNEEPPK